jgi:predicted nucleotidyltransferase
MRDAVDRVVTPFLAEVDAALGAGYTAILYGSGARGDFVPGHSDINLMLILDDITPATLRALGPAFAHWRKDSPEPPLVIGRGEWREAADTFPIEITDMRAACRVLRGADPLAGLVVERADLRRAVERELRGKLLRLRQGYTAAAADPLCSDRWRGGARRPSWSSSGAAGATGPVGAARSWSSRPRPPARSASTASRCST